MMIIFLLTESLDTMLNDENGLSETSVAAWTISYNIGYMSSSTSRTLEHWKAVNLATHTKSNLFYISIWIHTIRIRWVILYISFSTSRWWNLSSNMAQYKSSNEGNRNEVHPRMKLLPLHILHAVKGSKKLSPRTMTRITFQNNWYTIIRKLMFLFIQF
jgi:hypothetical protein